MKFPCEADFDLSNEELDDFIKWLQENRPSKCRFLILREPERYEWRHSIGFYSRKKDEIFKLGANEKIEL